MRVVSTVCKRFTCVFVMLKFMTRRIEMAWGLEWSLAVHPHSLHPPQRSFNCIHSALAVYLFRAWPQLVIMLTDHRGKFSYYVPACPIMFQLKYVWFWIHRFKFIIIYCQKCFSVKCPVAIRLWRTISDGIMSKDKMDLHVLKLFNIKV